MAERNIGFKRIEILQEETLGIGAYGKVCRARCDNLMCAAKILHPTLVQYHVDQSTLTTQQWPLWRFEQECELMSAIRHPNIVQYLGSHHDANTQLPVLLMELMNESLTHYLESSANDRPVPYHIQVNICHDITLALVFLHSNSIIHRDLSSNNILLTGSLQAKVTDFGMANLGDLSYQTRRIMTTCPGTVVYMPPEAVQDQPMYTEKIDCFSLGIIAIQIITRQFPNPGDQYIRQVNEHSTTLTVVPEIERRHNHISQIDPTSPILPLACDCLQDNPVQRPSAQFLCERFACLKDSPRYHSSEQATLVELVSDRPHVSDHEAIGDRLQVSDHETQLRHLQQIRRVIQSYETSLADKDHTIHSLQREKQQLSQQSSHQIETLQQEYSDLQQEVRQLQQQIREKDQQLLEVQKNTEVRLRQIERARQEIETKNHRIEALESQTESQRQRHIQEICHLQERISSQKQIINDSSTHISQKNEMIARKDALIAAKVKEIHSLEQQLRHLKEQSNKDHDTSSQVNSSMLDRQSSLSVSTIASSRASVLNLSANMATNQPVHRFQLEWSSKSKRAPCGMVAHCNTVVCGEVVYFQPNDTNSVYAYNSETDKWNQLPDVKNSSCSMATVNGLVTAIGGSKLIRGHSRKLYSLTGQGKGMKWTKILPSMPTKRSETSALCVEVALCLIVAGGEGKNGKTLAIVEVMNTDTKQWSRATDLPKPLWGASGTLCGNQFFIIGGVNVQPTRSVYRCDITSLLKSCQPAFHSSLVSEQQQSWDKVADLPVTGPTCVSLYEQLILIGGEDSNTRSTAIHIYDQTAGEWKVISLMSTSRNQCFAAVLPDNRLMVVGGWIDTIKDQTASDVIEFAKIEVLADYGHSA